MSEVIVNRQIFEYGNQSPFLIYNIGKQYTAYPHDSKDLLEHWHSEMEIVFNFVGNSMHYIDGTSITTTEDSIIFVNPESIHRVAPDVSAYEKTEVTAVVLIISESFLLELLPDYKDIYFAPGKEMNLTAIKTIMLRISEFAKEESTPYDFLLLRGYVYELFYWICKDCITSKDKMLPFHQQKSLERLRGVLQYIDNHYTEKITQQEVAQKFYFTKEYFSRFFKRYTGMTFKQYLKKYRIIKAYEEVVNTDKKLIDIALDHGFPDERAFINTFKEYYQSTPLKYRLSAKNVSF